MLSCVSGFRELRPLVHMLFPLCVHWMAYEMTVSVVADFTTNALCDGESTCSEVIYISGLQQTVVGIFKMVMIPLLGQLADEYGRKSLLILMVSTSIFPCAALAINQSRGFVYAYYVLQTISLILSQGSLFCVCISYAADLIEDSKRAAAFSWITGLVSVSHAVADVIARFLPEKCIFLVSTALLVLVPLYMQFFLVETVEWTPDTDENSSIVDRLLKVARKRYQSMRDAAMIVVHSPTLRGISFVSFFYQLGMTGIGSVLFYYLKAVFGFSKDQYSEILFMVDIGEIFSQMLVLPTINPLVGEKAILCLGLLGSIAYALLYGLAWAPWVAYLSASFGVVYILVTPATYAIISKATSSVDQGKAQGFVAGIEAIASFLSPLAMSPLTSWFLSGNAPFDCEGFSIVAASICMIVSLCFACLLKSEKPISCNPEEDIEEPLLGQS